MRKREINALKKVLRLSGWEKRGGHPDKTIARICGLLADAGFRERDRSGSGTPDGYHVWSGTEYRHPLGLVATLSTHYGAVAQQNNFSLTVRVVGKRRRT